MPHKRNIALRAVEKQTFGNKKTQHIACKNISLSYRGKLALQDIDLSIYKQEITAIIGPSGSGKSSFLSILNRLSDLIPGCEVKGDVFLDGEHIFQKNIDVVSLRKKVGMIFQKPNPFPLSIYENLAFPLREHGYREKTILNSKVQGALEAVGLWEEVKDRLRSPATQLSGGQMQRLCIARALALEPEILLFDEPCSALDPQATEKIENLLLNLSSSVTVVIVTHNIAQAKRISNSLAVFWSKKDVGRIIEFGETKKIFSSAQHELTRKYITGLTG